MTRFTACLFALCLSWPAYAAEPLRLEADCYDAEMVRDAIKGGSIEPMGVGVNRDEEMVVLFLVRGSGYWIALVMKDGKTVCDLSAGPIWNGTRPTMPGQES